MNDDPYHDGGTRGSSGGDTSRDAAYADLVHGVTSKAQRYVLIAAAQEGPRGVTVAELREKSGSLHHGRVSSAVTKQHIAGRLVALRERRNNSGVYVLPEHVNGRETRSYRRQNPKLQEDDIVGVLKEHRIGYGYGFSCICGHPSRNVNDHRRHVAAEIIALSKGESK